MLLVLGARRAVTGVIGTAAISGAMLFAGATAAVAQPQPAPPAPSPPGCTAGDLAQVSGGVATATSSYLFSHPDVNDFFTGLHGQPVNEIRDDVRTYMDSHPQVQSDMTAIRQPLIDLRNRCQTQ
jgi:heme-binding protein